MPWAPTSPRSARPSRRDGTQREGPGRGRRRRGGRCAGAVGASRPHVVGLIGIVVAFLAIGTLFALEQPPFVEADETAHVAYAHEIASFHLPRIDERVFPPASARVWRAEWASRGDDRYRGAWVANHPPLNYMLSAPAIWYSNWVGRPDGGLLFLRLQNVSLAAVGVALTYFVALELSRGDRRLGLLAAAMAALVPQGLALFSHGMNDGLAFAAGSGLLWATLRCCRRPGSRRDLLLLSGFAVASFGSRAATMLLAIALVGAAAAWALVERGRPFMARVRDRRAHDAPRAGSGQRGVRLVLRAQRAPLRRHRRLGLRAPLLPPPGGRVGAAHPRARARVDADVPADDHHRTARLARPAVTPRWSRCSRSPAWCSPCSPAAAAGGAPASCWRWERSP